MTMDSNMKLRAASAGDLDASEATPDGVDMGVDLVAQTYVVEVPAVTGTNPTLDVTIQESDNNSTWRTLGTFPQITEAGEYPITVKSNARYRRYTATLGGTDPNFGKTEIAPVPAGRYNKY